MKLFTVFGLLLLALTSCLAETDCGPCENECRLDAETQTEGHLIYLGSEFNDNSTTFSYQIETLQDDDECQDLSHWVLMVDCELCAPDTTPSSSCGRDGQRTLHGERIFGIKWEPSESSTSTVLDYSITFPGRVNETTVSYIVFVGTPLIIPFVMTDSLAPVMCVILMQLMPIQADV